jgi:hypothetical protein
VYRVPSHDPDPRPKEMPWHTNTIEHSYDS